MKAVILAAGFGSRLMPLTEKVPKTMVEYEGRCLIDYEISALRAAGVREIAVVGGYKFEVLRKFLEEKFQVRRFFENKNYDKTNMVATLFCAREFLQECVDGGVDLIVSYADIVYFEETVRKLLDCEGGLSIVVDRAWQRLWEQRFENPLEDAESLKFKEGKIIELGKKPSSYAEIESQYIGLFKISHAFLPKVLAFYDRLDRDMLYDGKDFDNMYMTSFLQGLIDKFGGAKAAVISGGWCEIDFKKDLSIKIQ